MQASVSSEEMKSDGVAETQNEYTLRIDYEHEHRDAEHEQSVEHEQSDADEGFDRPYFLAPESTSRAR